MGSPAPGATPPHAPAARAPISYTATTTPRDARSPSTSSSSIRVTSPPRSIARGAFLRRALHDRARRLGRRREQGGHGLGVELQLLDRRGARARRHDAGRAGPRDRRRELRRERARKRAVAHLQRHVARADREATRAHAEHRGERALAALEEAVASPCASRAPARLRAPRPRRGTTRRAPPRASRGAQRTTSSRSVRTVSPSSRPRTSPSPRAAPRRAPSDAGTRERARGSRESRSLCACTRRRSRRAPARAAAGPLSTRAG